MQCLRIITALTLIVGTPLFAQDDANNLMVNVNLPDRQGGSSGGSSAPLKLFLDGHELPVSGVKELPGTPLHVVFVLDNGGHQQRMMSLTQDYVAKLGMAIHSSQATYTVLVAAKEPKILADTSNAAELSTDLAHVDTSLESSRDVSADLNGGIVKAGSILETMPGARAIVIFSDDDDDINGKAMQSLKEEMAGAHIRCFSILLAQHDFFGTKARTAWGIRLNSLANFSGGAQYDTYWQNRQSDELVLKTVATRISYGSLVSFSIPPSVKMRPGIHTLKAQFGEGQPMIRTSPFLISH